MSESNQFDWVDFYKELARNLLSYKENRKELIQKVKQIFSDTGVNMPTLEKDNQLIDIDPFTVFGLFNSVVVESTFPVIDRTTMAIRPSFENSEKAME